MNTTAVSPAEIDVFLAELCPEAVAEMTNYHGGYGNHTFTESLDALFAPGGPVEKCRERGWGMRLDDAGVAGWEAGGYGPCPDCKDCDSYDSFDLTAPTAALALAEACYKVLK
jgi:hypothetical protein